MAPLYKRVLWGGVFQHISCSFRDVFSLVDQMLSGRSCDLSLRIHQIPSKATLVGRLERAGIIIVLLRYALLSRIEKFSCLTHPRE